MQPSCGLLTTWRLRSEDGRFKASPGRRVRETLVCRTVPSPMDLIGFGFAAVVILESIWSYRRKGGVVFLIAGLFFGILSAYGAYRISRDQRDIKLSLYAAFFLATLMGTRFKRSKRIKPAGLMAGLSFLMILRLVLLLL
ncbi:transmembrane protein 14A isoform 1-T1 [Thomomys bottae]